MTESRRRPLILAAALAAVPAAVAVTGSGTAAGQSGANLCSFHSTTGVLDVSRTSLGGEVRITSSSDGSIKVESLEVVSRDTLGYVPVACQDVDAGGGPAAPTVTTTDTVVVAANGLELQTLVPGRTLDGEGASPEIEVSLTNAVETLSLLAPAPEATTERSVAMGMDGATGQMGINLNAGSEGADADADVVGVPPRFSVGFGFGGPAHLVDATGFDDFELPLSTRVYAHGGDGADRLLGGTNGDVLSGGAGDDELRGGAGNDELNPGAGNDLADGGADRDLLELWDGTAGKDPDVTIDLSASGSQDTGFGVDTVTDLESVSTGEGDDTIVGSSAANSILSHGGNDTASGGDGDDELIETYGNDRFDGGAGNDLVAGALGRDRLRGGDGDDRVRGEEGNDVVDGGPGVDRLSGGAGLDRLLARDGIRDASISCGRPFDRHEQLLSDPQDPNPVSC